LALELSASNYRNDRYQPGAVGLWQQLHVCALLIICMRAAHCLHLLQQLNNSRALPLAASREHLHCVAHTVSFSSAWLLVSCRLLLLPGTTSPLAGLEHQFEASSS
jgi:hypothetical protein